MKVSKNEAAEVMNYWHVKSTYINKGEIKMLNSLFNDKKQIFRDTIRLAENWRNAYDISTFEGGSISEIHAFEATAEGQKINAFAIELDDYLQSLDFDEVKMLQTIMYLGRDKDYDKSLPPHLIYENEFNYFEKNGWVNKEVEINQMTEKIPLADYLKSGLDILKVTI